LKDGGKTVRNRPFAIGARNMNTAELAVGVSEVLVEGKGGGEALFISTHPDFLENRGAVIQIVYCLLIVHA
jgi:hypothetical protein